MVVKITALSQIEWNFTQASKCIPNFVHSNKDNYCMGTLMYQQVYTFHDSITQMFFERMLHLTNVCMHAWISVIILMVLFSSGFTAFPKLFPSFWAKPIIVAYPQTSRIWHASHVVHEGSIVSVSALDHGATNDYVMLLAKIIPRPPAHREDASKMINIK